MVINRKMESSGLRFLLGVDAAKHAKELVIELLMPICTNSKQQLSRHHPQRLIRNAHCTPPLKLPQESNVVLKEKAQIIDTIFQHSYALNSHSERKSCDYLGIVPHHLENLRINHT